MKILGCTRHTISVLGLSGSYTYECNPYNRRKVVRWVKQKFYGRAWQLLRTMRRVDNVKDI